MRTRLTATALAAMLATVTGCAQPEAQQQPQQQQAFRTAWGEPDLSGIWMGGGTWTRSNNNLALLESLYKPDVYAQMKKVTEKDDPLLRCVPYGMPRAVLSSPWPFQIVQAPGQVVLL